MATMHQGIRSTLPDASDNRTVRLDGAQLTALRRTRGLTREQLAAAADGPHRLSEATIKRAETGARVYLETARRLAGILEVPVDVLIDAPDRDSSAPLTSLESGATTSSTAVAVLQFHALDDDPRTRAIADGLSEDLTTRLSSWWFPVICRGSTAQHRLLAEDNALARDLNVAYVVEGSVQQRGDFVRLHARLLGAHSHTVHWAQEYNRPSSKMFALQDELASDILDSVNQKLLVLTERQLAGQQDADLKAWELAARGSRLFYEGTRAANARARELLRQAVDGDPTLSWAMYLLALSYQRELVNQWTDLPRDSHAHLRELSAHMQRHHPDDGRTEVVAAYVDVYEGQRERAIERLQAAIATHPNLFVAYSLLGQALAMRGDAEPALEQLELAVRLSPRDRDLWTTRTATALAYFVAEDYKRTVEWATAAVSVRPDIPFSYGALAAAHALLGERDQAKRSLDEMLRLHPKVSLDGFNAILASTRPEIAARYLKALQLAGL